MPQRRPKKPSGCPEVLDLAADEMRSAVRVLLGIDRGLHRARHRRSDPDVPCCKCPRARPHVDEVCCKNASHWNKWDPVAHIFEPGTHFVYEDLRRPRSGRGAPPLASVHPFYLKVMAILYRVAELIAECERREEMGGPNRSERRRAILKKWNVWRAPKLSRATVKRWRDRLGLTSDEIDAAVVKMVREGKLPAW